MDSTNEQQNFAYQLLALGFTQKEVVVYLSLLALGKGTVATITRKAGINRTTCYDFLAGLVTKKLISISGKEPKQEYVAESPERILAYTLLLN